MVAGRRLERACSLRLRSVNRSIAGTPPIARVLLGLFALLPAPVRAQSACLQLSDTAAATRWDGPLSRRVTLHAADIAIDEALDQIAAAANVRFSYSGDAVPLERRVCASYAATPIGVILTGLLRDTNLQPVVAGVEHIVLAPLRAGAVQHTHADVSPEVVALEPVHVHGEAGGAAPASATVDAVVLDGRKLPRRASTTLAEVLNGAVPGVWLWHDADGTRAAFGSMRGASSFHTTAPKVYIDGIEVANSQLLARISPASVERIEIIRGPQGAALYGANALSGIINIITRRDYTDGGSPLRSVHTGVAMTASDFAGQTTLSQDHAVRIASGTDRLAGGINVAVGTLGEFAPGAQGQHMAADAFGRIAGSHSVVTATARLLRERSGIRSSPLLPDSLQLSGFPFAAPSAGTRDLASISQYTAGFSAAYQPGSHWTHTFVAGLDGFSADDPAATQDASHHAAAEGLLGAWRATARASSVRRFHPTPTAAVTFVLAADHSLLRQSTSFAMATPVRRVEKHSTDAQQPPTVLRAARVVEHESSATGFSTQASLLWHDRLLLTGGMRFERNGSPSLLDRWAALPMLGGALLARDGAVDLRLRAAFGRAIRWPAGPTATSDWNTAYRALEHLAEPAEEQTGVEAGIDVRIGEFAALHVTRFEQIATGITQPSVIRSAHPTRHVAVARPQFSVGTIENRGWELQASLAHGRLGLTGALSFVDSRVRRLAAGYVGELRAGDRMLAVPARTASLSASWSELAWSVTLSASRATDWINYDRLALLRDLSNSTGQPRPDLRSYWRRYDGFTHLDIVATRRISDRFTFAVTGSNLLGLQVGEPDNLTIVPGRTFSFGLHATF